MKERILKWLFGNDIEEYMYVFKHWNDSVDGWGEAIRIGNEACARNERLIDITEKLINRYKNILRKAIIAYEWELEMHNCGTKADIHAVVLNKFGITNGEYNDIMGVNENEMDEK